MSVIGVGKITVDGGSVPEIKHNQASNENLHFSEMICTAIDD